LLWCRLCGSLRTGRVLFRRPGHRADLLEQEEGIADPLQPEEQAVDLGRRRRSSRAAAARRAP